MLRRQSTVQNFTLSATAQISAAFGVQTRCVMLSASSTGANMGGAFVLFGDSTGIAATSANGILFPAPWMDTFDVTPGQRISVIEASTSHGTLSVTEMV